MTPDETVAEPDFAPLVNATWAVSVPYCDTVKITDVMMMLGVKFKVKLPAPLPEANLNAVLEKAA